MVMPMSSALLFGVHIFFSKEAGTGRIHLIVFSRSVPRMKWWTCPHMAAFVPPAATLQRDDNFESRGPSSLTFIPCNGLAAD